MARPLLAGCSHPSLPCSHWAQFVLSQIHPERPSCCVFAPLLPQLSAPFQALDSTAHPRPASVPSLVARCWDWPVTGLFPARAVCPEGARHPMRARAADRSYAGSPREDLGEPAGGGGGAAWRRRGLSYTWDGAGASWWGGLGRDAGRRRHRQPVTEQGLGVSGPTGRSDTWPCPPQCRVGVGTSPD